MANFLRRVGAGNWSHCPTGVIEVFGGLLVIIPRTSAIGPAVVALMERLRKLLATVGLGLTPVDMATMEQEIETSLWQERMLSFLSELFGALAVLIAATGSFGLIAFILARRTREIGIRIAIGAMPMSVVGLFARSSILAVAPGIVIDCGAFVATRSALGPLLFGRGTGIAVPVVTSAMVITLVTIVAVALPAFRATQIQPTVALREE